MSYNLATDIFLKYSKRLTRAVEFELRDKPLMVTDQTSLKWVLYRSRYISGSGKEHETMLP